MDLVLLDLDGTLVDHDTAERAAMLGWIEEAGLPPQIDGIATELVWHNVAEAAFEDWRAGRMSFAGQRRVRVVEFYAAMGVDVSGWGDTRLDEEFGQYRRRYEAAWEPFPDAEAGLAALGRSARVAVLSNGDHAQQADKLRRTGLDVYVETLITSSDLGVAKPDRRAFTAAVAQLGVAPGAALYCGDLLDVDARPAAAAGLTGIWLDRLELAQGAVTDVPVVASLLQLASLVER